MTIRKIAVLAAGLGQPSSTRLLADRLAEATVRHLQNVGVDSVSEVVELRDTAQEVVTKLTVGTPSFELETAIEVVTSADALIAVTPVFMGSYSGLFKSFIDVLDPTSLTDMPVLIGASGGSERHSLALDYAMRPLFTHLHAVVVPTGIFAAQHDWKGTAPIGADPQSVRIERAAGELAGLVSQAAAMSIQPTRCSHMVG